MSAVESDLAPSDHEFAVGDCVSIDLENPIAVRYSSGLLSVPVGRVFELRSIQFGLIHSTEVAQCYVQWEENGEKGECSWVDSDLLLPAANVAEMIQAAADNIAHTIVVTFSPP